MSLLSMQEYIHIAEKMLIKRGLTLDDEAIAYMVEFMAKADEMFDGRGSRIKFRGYRGLFGLSRWFRDCKRKHKHISLNTVVYSDDRKDVCLVDMIPDKNTKIDYRIKKIIDTVTSATYLSDRDKDMVFGHYLQSMTLQQLGNKYTLSRERVRQIIDNAIYKIKKDLDV